ncbi:zinc finger protein OZF-like [Anthonomus grandis grandis]|uniref:zinc finger protein OZF-like n=1 Tax=Anthonomus grandis grandis TaxID=2921223 RepID=UPI002166463A|nr:zinc finger protein OZF-like [Anthonomus grandis grandis]
MNEEQSLSYSSFSSICRTCLTYDEVLFSIKDVQYEEIYLKDIVNDWTSLKVSLEDKLPQQMCKPCVKMMYQIYKFLSKCKTSETCLKDVLKKHIATEESDGETKLENVDVKSSNLIINENDNYFAHSEVEIKVDNTSDDSDTDGLAEQVSDEELENGETSDKFDDDGDDSKQTTKKRRARNKTKIMRKLISKADGSASSKRTYTIKKGPFKCITCSSIFQSYEELKVHKIETKHKKSLKYTCSYCEKKFDAFCKYEEHVRTHTGEKPNKCTTCGKCFNFKTDLKRHMVMHMEVKPYTCQFCEKGFARRQYLIDHERKHTGQQLLLCPFCGKGFHSYSTLSYHEKMHIGPKGSVRNPLQEDRLYQCNICEKTLLTKHTLKSHILLHGPKNFNCDICGKTYITTNRLQDHKKIAHQENTYSCHICQKEYRQKTGLQVHMKSHFGQNNYICDECGKHFSCKGSLYQHKRVHSGDTKYQCKECFHICLNKRHLENHQRIHTGEKPFACSYCGKQFAQKANMQAHTKIHTHERNHVCKVCDKAFYDSRGLKKHMGIHEKDDRNGVD